MLRPTDSEVQIYFCGSYIIKYLLASVTVSVSGEQFQVLKAWSFLLSLLTSKVKVSLRWSKFPLFYWWISSSSMGAGTSWGSSPVQLQGWIPCTLPIPCSFLSEAVVTWWEDIIPCYLHPHIFLLVCPLLLFFPICESKEPVQKVSECCSECNTWAKGAWCWQSDYLTISILFLILCFPALCSSVWMWDTISDEPWSAGGGGCSSCHDMERVDVSSGSALWGTGRFSFLIPLFTRGYVKKFVKRRMHIGTTGQLCQCRVCLTGHHIHSHVS